MLNIPPDALTQQITNRQFRFIIFSDTSNLIVRLVKYFYCPKYEFLKNSFFYTKVLHNGCVPPSNLLNVPLKMLRRSTEIFNGFSSSSSWLCYENNFLLFVTPLHYWVEISRLSTSALTSYKCFMVFFDVCILTSVISIILQTLWNLITVRLLLFVFLFDQSLLFLCL